SKFSSAASSVATLVPLLLVCCPGTIVASVARERTPSRRVTSLNVASGNPEIVAQVPDGPVTTIPSPRPPRHPLTNPRVPTSPHRSLDASDHANRPSGPDPAGTR